MLACGACSALFILGAQVAQLTSSSSQLHVPSTSAVTFGEEIFVQQYKGGERGFLHHEELSLARRWNNSAATFVVLGQKAARDFGVYAWPFEVHGYRLAAPKAGYLNLTPGPPDTPPFKGVGAMLCHSLFLSNCVHGYRGTMKPEDGGIYSRLRGMKFNRIAGVRQVLSTKDGLCRTLQRSGLSAVHLAEFAFPCWVLPMDSSKLAHHIGELEAGSPSAWNDAQHEARHVNQPSTPPAMRSQAPLFIVKPARGSLLRLLLGF